MGGIQQFYNKYVYIEEELSPIERKLLEQEHPYQEMEIKDIWINREKVRRWIFR